MGDAVTGRFDVAGNLRAELARRQMTWRELAERLAGRSDSELTEIALTRRLNGKIRFRADELPAIAAVLDLPLVALLGEEQAS